MEAILALEAKAECDDALKSDSRRTPTSVSRFPFQEQKLGQKLCGASIRDVSSRAFCSDDATSLSGGADDDNKSVSSKTILSGDITECSEYLIASMQQVKMCFQASLGETVMASPLTRLVGRNCILQSGARNQPNDNTANDGFQ